MFAAEGEVESGGRLECLAGNHEVHLQGLDDEFAAGGAAGDEDLGNADVLLVLKKIDEGAQFAAQRVDEWFEGALDFGGHADFDAFGFGVADAHGVGESLGDAVAAHVNNAMHDEVALLKHADGGVAKAEVDEGHGFVREGFGFVEFEGVERPDESGDDLGNVESGGAARSGDVVGKLAFASADDDFLFLSNGGLCRFAVRNGRDDDCTIKNVIGQVLLEVILCIELEQLAHVAQGHGREFRAAHNGVGHSKRDDDGPGGLGIFSQRAHDALEVLGKNINRK